MGSQGGGREGKGGQLQMVVAAVEEEAAPPVAGEW